MMACKRFAWFMIQVHLLKMFSSLNFISIIEVTLASVTRITVSFKNSDFELSLDFEKH